ncbi:variable large family protein [Borrelia nietonii]|uniref:variable large family protein n=1 Tax=Borrelia nietonii TaxID=3117462 RepID=UPI0038B29155
MVAKVLGFNTETKKSDVGASVKEIQDTVQGTKEVLQNGIRLKSEGNPNAVAVETAVTNLVTTTLDKIIQRAKTASEVIGTIGDDLIGNVANCWCWCCWY